MAGEPISVDDLLSRQDQPGRILATVEVAPEQEDRVKVTPFVAGRGCLCSRALVIGKDAIESLTTTDDVHVCCGKRLMVVEVSFADGTLQDVFQQVVDAAQEGPEAQSTRLDPAAMPVAGYQFPQELPPPYVRPLYASPVGQAFYPNAFDNPLGSTEELATGFWTWARCAWNYGRCVNSCSRYSPAYLNAAANARCMCQCENDRARCLDPLAMPNPCT